MTITYTLISTAQGETDEFERWFEHDFETPAAVPIQKVISGAQLTPKDWECLIRFAAALDVRTPIRMLERLEDWKKMLPILHKEVLAKTIQEFSSLSREERYTISKPEKEDLLPPMRVARETKHGKPTNQISFEILKGRKLWLWSVKHVLTNTAKALLQHRWTIVHPAKDLT